MELFSKLMNRLKKIEPCANCTYFPMEHRWMVFVNNKQITKFHRTGVNAVQDAISILELNRK